MSKWPHKCSGWKASESDPSFCANCGNIASGHKGPTPGAPRQFRMSVSVKPKPKEKRSEKCPVCGRSVRVFVPAGADGSVDLFVTHPNPDKPHLSCDGSRRET